MSIRSHRRKRPAVIVPSLVDLYGGPGLAREVATHKEEIMTEIKDVADVRIKASLNDEDRRAIRRSILMALIGVAAVTAAALLSPSKESAPADVADRTSHPTAVTPAAPTEPTEPVGTFVPQPATPPGERIETSAN